MDAVFLDYETVSYDDLDLTALRRAVAHPEDRPGGLTLYAATTEEELAARMAPAQIVLTNKVRLGAAELAAAPRLELIALSATGTDNVDLGAAAARGIAVCNVREYCTASVVQHVWALILALTQHLADYQRFIAEGAWRSGSEGDVLKHPIRELAGRTLGIVGYGALGGGVARAATAFGMERVLIAERPRSDSTARAPSPGRVPLDELLARADIVSLHCPLT
ncbi:MAG TPA: NAD(P)-dependent oxidoreductase, partial [Steroidobacteraceae bacterium]|nr:NAD(P)-dependent oxidoreductase [Steroidobacteraceae bacterium]